MNYEIYLGKEVNLTFPEYYDQYLKAIIVDINEFGMLFEILPKYPEDTMSGRQIFISKNSVYHFEFEDSVRKNLYHDDERNFKITEKEYTSAEMLELVQTVFGEECDIYGDSYCYDDYSVSLNHPATLDAFSEHFQLTVLSVEDINEDDYRIAMLTLA